MLLSALLPSKTNSTTNISATIIYNIIIHSVCCSVCQTEVRTLYGRLSRRWQPRVGCVRWPWLHATHWAQRAIRFQWGLSQRAWAATGAFLNGRCASTASFRTPQVKPKRDCRLLPLLFHSCNSDAITAIFWVLQTITAAATTSNCFPVTTTYHIYITKQLQSELSSVKSGHVRRN